MLQSFLFHKEDGSTASEYDANGDGIFNIEDYQDDPRIDWTSGQDDGDDMLDPSDLIYTFSDGVDDDGNGYVTISLDGIL